MNYKLYISGNPSKKVFKRKALKHGFLQDIGFVFQAYNKYCKSIAEKKGSHIKSVDGDYVGMSAWIIGDDLYEIREV